MNTAHVTVLIAPFHRTSDLLEQQLCRVNMVSFDESVFLGKGACLEELLRGPRKKKKKYPRVLTLRNAPCCSK